MPIFMKVLLFATIVIAVVLIVLIVVGIIIDIRDYIRKKHS